MNGQALTESGFGVEMGSTDIASLSEAEKEAVIAAFHDAGGLLLLRNQAHANPQQLIDFIRLFGAVELNEKYDPDFLEPGFPELLRIGNTRKDGKYSALFIQADPPPLMWHTDDSFRDPQPAGSCLFCVQTPSKGGDTGFAGMQQAWECLDPELKEQIDGLTAIHSYDYLNEELRKNSPHRPPLSEELKKLLPPIERPLVAQHPVNRRKGLYLPISHIESIPGLEEAETCALLKRLMTHMTQEPFVYMHQWKPGDLVVWDNRSAMHAPTAFDDENEVRLMYRLTFNGEQIVGF